MKFPLWKAKWFLNGMVLFGGREHVVKFSDAGHRNVHVALEKFNRPYEIGTKV